MLIIHAEEELLLSIVVPSETEEGICDVVGDMDGACDGNSEGAAESQALMHTEIDADEPVGNTGQAKSSSRSLGHSKSPTAAIPAGQSGMSREGGVKASKEGTNEASMAANLSANKSNSG